MTATEEKMAVLRWASGGGTPETQVWDLYRWHRDGYRPESVLATFTGRFDDACKWARGWASAQHPQWRLWGAEHVPSPPVLSFDAALGYTPPRPKGGDG